MSEKKINYVMVKLFGRGYDKVLIFSRYNNKGTIEDIEYVEDTEDKEQNNKEE